MLFYCHSNIDNYFKWFFEIALRYLAIIAGITYLPMYIAITLMKGNI